MNIKKGVFAMIASTILAGSAAAAEKSIVIYFSHTGENYSVGVITEGNTAKVAKEIARQTGAAIHEIKEAEPYPVKYNACIDRAKKELQAKARPAIQGEIPDLSAYDTIYLGYPNWWGDAPMVVYSFLDKAKSTARPSCRSAPTRDRASEQPPAIWRRPSRRQRLSRRGWRCAARPPKRIQPP